MKVKDLIKKYRLCSNALVVIGVGGTEYPLKHEQIVNVEPDWLMNRTVASLDVVNNVFTIWT